MSKQRKTERVADAMIADVVTVSPFAKVREAMRLMRGHGVKSLVVEKQDDADAYGIITYTTLLKTIVAEEGDVDLVNVYDIAAKPAISVPPQIGVRHAVQLMVTLGIRRLVVIDGNELKGILTMNDIVGNVLEMIEDGPGGDG